MVDAPPTHTCLVGVGSFGAILLSKLAKTSSVRLAINPSRRPAVVELCDQLGVPLHDSLDAIPEDVKWVAVATPVPSHVSVVRQMLERGFHVYCQKPLAPTEQEAKELFAFARSCGCRLFVDEVFLHREAMTALQREVAISRLTHGEFSWVKKSTNHDPIPYALAYHDIYLALAFGFLDETTSRLTITRHTESELTFEAERPTGITQFTYDRQYPAAAEKVVRLFDADGERAIWHNRTVTLAGQPSWTEREDALENQIGRLLRNEIDLERAEVRSVLATRIIERLSSALQTHSQVVELL